MATASSAHRLDADRPEARGGGRQHHQPDRQQRAQRLEAADEVEHDQPRKMKCTGVPSRLTERRNSGSRHSATSARQKIASSDQRDGGDRRRSASAPRRSSASTVPNSTCIRSTLEPRSDTISTPSASEIR